jgi:hypothetical protein
VEKLEDNMATPYTVSQDWLERVGTISDRTRVLFLFKWLKAAKLLVIQ